MTINPLLNASYDVGSPWADLAALLFPDNNGLFINEFKKFSGINHVYPTNWGRTALFIALKSLNLKNKRIAVNAYTSPTVAFTVRDAGYIPVPIDINLTNLGIDIDCLNRIISQGIGALIITHLFGFPDDIDKLLNITKEKGIIIIEDCANSLGSFYADKHTGTFGDISFFSFRIGKPLGVGGGMLCVNTAELQERITAYYNNIKLTTTAVSLCKIETEKLLYKRPLYGLFTRPMRNFAKDKFFNKIIFKGSAVDIYSKVCEDSVRKMSRRQLSIAYFNLKRFRENSEIRKNICNRYREKLPRTMLPELNEKNTCNNSFFPVILPSANILEKLIKQLRCNNIDVSRFHYASPFLAYGNIISQEAFPNTLVLCERLINLPVLPKKSYDFYLPIIKIINAAI